MEPTGDVKRAPLLIRDRAGLRDWVREHVTVKELDRMRCPHCGCGTAAHEAIDAVTDSILAGDHPALGGDWAEFFADLDCGDLTDLVRE